MKEDLSVRPLLKINNHKLLYNDDISKQLKTNTMRFNDLLITTNIIILLLNI